MRCVCQLRSILSVLGLFILQTGHTQVADSLKQRLTVLREQYRANILKDTDYLRSVDSIAPMLELEDSLPELLSIYREITFSHPAYGRRRAGYYAWLALNAYNNNRLGSAVYYAEKNNDEKVAAGILEKGSTSHNDMFAVSVYYNNRDYSKVMIKYALLHSALAAVPAGIQAGKVNDDAAWVAMSILQAVVYSAAHTGDGQHLEE